MPSLQDIAKDFTKSHIEYLSIMAGLPLAAPDKADGDIVASITAEGVFLRYFTLWENSIEKVFLYFCGGGPSLGGKIPSCRLVPCTPEEARKIVLANQRYLDWSDQKQVRDRAQLFFNTGEPFYSPLIGKSHVLADTEKLRNVIAHNSIESWNGYRQVQRNNFLTEPNFFMVPGQLLRVRRRSTSENWGTHYFTNFAETFVGIIN